MWAVRLPMQRPSRNASFHDPGRLIRHAASVRKILQSANVLVCVRERPLNRREIELGSDECIECTGKTSLEISYDGQKRTFTFDAVVPRSAPQAGLYSITAQPILSKVLSGYNGCIFAYGQTGAGKTYTMIGSGDLGTGKPTQEAGLIPRVCYELFAKIEEAKLRFKYVVTCCFLEIYKENIRDLLASNVSEAETDNKTRSFHGDLVIREDKSVGGRGIYVTGARERIVRSWDDVRSILNEGTAKRVVGETNMNAASSRSHAVISFRVSRQDLDDSEGFTRLVSKLHLIDLAGSERAKSTGATGARLREGASINTSLSALGNVVNALTQKGKRGHIPYRDSKLTRLLQDSLGGNAFTLMMCNISPALVNAAETLSSLRFAQRAKMIENKASVNRDPKLARIFELTQENERLRKRIQDLEAKLAAAKRTSGANTKVEPKISSKIRPGGDAMDNSLNSSVMEETTPGMKQKKTPCCTIS